NLAYDWKGRPLAQGQAGQINWEITPAAGASLGTVATNVRGGAMLRFGDNLEPNFGPARIRPSLTGAGHFNAADPVDWYAFVGVQGRAVAHDIFLDGSLVRDDSPSIAKNTYVADVQAGFALTQGGIQLSWTYVHRTERFQGQRGADDFGAFTLSTKF
ncbi:MAG: lipid A deacylase LpxR family protein, partial [Parvularculaceae bacterium]|nr:lipid A deacylase LpxR family protein [Parvularculaceae bacterium]